MASGICCTQCWREGRAVASGISCNQCWEKCEKLKMPYGLQHEKLRLPMACSTSLLTRTSTRACERKPSRWPAATAGRSEDANTAAISACEALGREKGACVISLATKCYHLQCCAQCLRGPCQACAVLLKRWDDDNIYVDQAGCCRTCQACSSTIEALGQ
jgi:hypothetical protein